MPSCACAVPIISSDAPGKWLANRSAMASIRGPVVGKPLPLAVRATATVTRSLSCAYTNARPLNASESAARTRSPVAAASIVAAKIPTSRARGVWEKSTDQPSRSAARASAVATSAPLWVTMGMSTFLPCSSTRVPRYSRRAETRVRPCAADITLNTAGWAPLASAAFALGRTPYGNRPSESGVRHPPPTAVDVRTCPPPPLARFRRHSSGSGACGPNNRVRRSGANSAAAKISESFTGASPRAIDANRVSPCGREQGPAPKLRGPDKCQTRSPANRD